MGRIVLAALSALALMLGSVQTRADAVAPAPEDCPPGTHGHTNHLGPHCRPSPCKSDADCSKGQSCKPHALCVTRRTHQSRRGDTTQVAAKESCTGGRTCPDPATCEPGNYCMAPESPWKLVGCNACHVTRGAPAPGGMGAMWWLAGLGGLVVRRKRATRRAPRKPGACAWR